MTLEEFKKRLEESHDRVVNFKKYDYWKDQRYIDRAHNTFGRAQTAVPWQKKGNFYGNPIR